MEAATKQSSELHATSGPVTRDIQFTSTGNCYRCGGKGHPREKCYFKTQKCKNCGQKGHIAKVCRATQKQQSAKNLAQPPPRRTKSTRQHANFVDNNQTTPDQTDAETTDLRGMFTINSVNNQPNNCINVELLINGIPLKMTLDTGASVTIISAAT